MAVNKLPFGSTARCRPFAWQAAVRSPPAPLPTRRSYGDDCQEPGLACSPHHYWRNTAVSDGMLYRFMIGESRALRLLGDDDWTRRVGSANVKFILEKAAETAIPIDVTVEDPETHHRHREPIDNIECDGGCLQLLTAGSDMPIHSDSIDSAWAERKSTSTGVVISLVIVDRRSRPRFILTGQRPQCIAWRALIEWLLLKEAEAPAAA